MTKLQNNYTTSEQSKKLIEIGLPIWTADMSRQKSGCDYVYKPFVHDSFQEEEAVRDEYDKVMYRKYYEPCWSLGRLMEIYEICAKFGSLDWLTREQIKKELGLNYVEYLVYIFDRHVRIFKDIDFSKLEE